MSHGMTHGSAPTALLSRANTRAGWVPRRGQYSPAVDKVSARRCLKPFHTLGVKDMSARPLAAEGKTFAQQAGYTFWLLAGSPWPAPGRQLGAVSRPVLTGSSMCHPQTLGWDSPRAYCVQFAFVGGPTSAHSAA